MPTVVVRAFPFERETFLLLFKNGWYELECADSNKINKKYNVLTQEYMDLELE